MTELLDLVSRESKIDYPILSKAGGDAIQVSAEAEISATSLAFSASSAPDLFKQQDLTNATTVQPQETFTSSVLYFVIGGSASSVSASNASTLYKPIFIEAQSISEGFVFGTIYYYGEDLSATCSQEAKATGEVIAYKSLEYKNPANAAIATLFLDNEIGWIRNQLSWSSPAWVPEGYKASRSDSGGDLDYKAKVFLEWQRAGKETPTASSSFSIGTTEKFIGFNYCRSTTATEQHLTLVDDSFIAHSKSLASSFSLTIFKYKYIDSTALAVPESNGSMLLLKLKMISSKALGISKFVLLGDLELRTKVNGAALSKTFLSGRVGTTLYIRFPVKALSMPGTSVRITSKWFIAKTDAYSVCFTSASLEKRRYLSNVTAQGSTASSEVHISSRRPLRAGSASTGNISTKLTLRDLSFRASLGSILSSIGNVSSKEPVFATKSASFGSASLFRIYLSKDLVAVNRVRAYGRCNSYTLQKYGNLSARGLAYTNIIENISIYNVLYSRADSTGRTVVKNVEYYRIFYHIAAMGWTGRESGTTLTLYGTFSSSAVSLGCESNSHLAPGLPIKAEGTSTSLSIGLDLDLRRKSLRWKVKFSKGNIYSILTDKPNLRYLQGLSIGLSDATRINSRIILRDNIVKSVTDGSSSHMAPGTPLVSTSVSIGSFGENSILRLTSKIKRAIVSIVETFGLLKRYKQFEGSGLSEAMTFSHFRFPKWPMPPGSSLAETSCYSRLFSHTWISSTASSTSDTDVVLAFLITGSINAMTSSNAYLGLSKLGQLRNLRIEKY